MSFISKNTFTGIQVYRMQYASTAEIHANITKLHDYFTMTKYENTKVRMDNILKVQEAITSAAPKLAELISIETGKPYKQSCHEIKLVLNDINFYRKNSKPIMRNKLITKTNEQKAGYSFKPIGITFNVARRYLPFYSMMKLAIPN